MRDVRRHYGVLVMSGALTSSNGHFSCTPDHAVEIAYAMNLAEAVIMKFPLAEFDMGTLLFGYLSGDRTIEEIQEELREWLKELKGEG